MKVTELSKKAAQFMALHWDKSFATESGMIIRFVEIDGWLRVMLEIGERTINQDIRDAAPMLLEWRDRLVDFQGAWDRGGTNHTLETLSRRQEHGQSYARLAEMINNKIEEQLKGYITYRQEVDAVHPELKAEHDKDIFYHVFWLGMNSNSSTLSHAKGLLEDLNYQEQEIVGIIQSGLDGVFRGESIFSKAYPVSRQKMIEVLRTWRKSKLHLAIQKQEKIVEEEFKKQRDGTV